MNPTATTSILFTGVVAAWFAAFGYRHFAALDSLRLELAGCYARAEASEAEIERGALLARCAEDLDTWDRELAPLLRRPTDASPLLLAAQTAMKADGLAIERAEALSPDTSWKRPHERIRAAVTGTFGQVFQALTRLENTAPPTRVVEFTLQSSPDGATVRAELVVVRTWQEGR
ncbi:MAG: hypothetical protein JNK15_20575 [Planctomycetes bacterium]|nr:hypothetical protein [Planctomycetota bacterium]